MGDFAPCSRFLALCFSFLVARSKVSITRLLRILCIGVLGAAAQAQQPATPKQKSGAEDAPQGAPKQEQFPEFSRPKPGSFPPLEKARTYRGELVFVDHANRRGSLRIDSEGVFRFNSPQPFALLPYGMVRYHGAPADLRDIPLGTMLHVRAFLPPDLKTSPVPILPVDDTTRSGTNAAPAENHIFMLEDEPSDCLHKGEVWKLNEVELRKEYGMIVAIRVAKDGGSTRAGEESLSMDAATRIWRGAECLSIGDLVAEGTWPSEGKKSLGGQPALLGIMWKPTPGSVFRRFHISDIWLDDTAMQRASQRQTETHRSFIRSRWMPAWVDAVEYGTFGRATVTATLFGGMDSSLYADFKPGIEALVNGVENTLKHTEGGTAGPTQMAARGHIRDVERPLGTPPAGSSGIQIRFETDLITEGIRPTRIIRVRPASWPDVHMPREEYIDDRRPTFEERFPTPAIFPKY